MHTRIRRGLVALAGMLVGLVLASSALAQQAQVPRFDSPVVDTTGTLDAASQDRLRQQALALQQRKGSQLQVLMVPTTAPETIEQYAVRAFGQFKLGRKGVDDGVLLVVAKDDHKARIEVGYGLEGAIPDIAAGRVIQEYLLPKFRQDDYAGGIEDATAQLVRLVDGEPLPEPLAASGNHSDPSEGMLFAMFAAFIVAQVARGLVRGSSRDHARNAVRHGQWPGRMAAVRTVAGRGCRGLDRPAGRHGLDGWRSFRAPRRLGWHGWRRVWRRRVRRGWQ